MVLCTLSAMMDNEFYLAVSVSGSWRTESSLMSLGNTCAFPTSQSVCCEKGLLKHYPHALPHSQHELDLYKDCFLPHKIYGLNWTDCEDETTEAV